MGIVGWLAREQVRGRTAALTALALTAALGTAATLVAAGASDRTGNAYVSYRHRAQLGDIEINPSLVSIQIDRAVRALPGVEAVTSDALLEAGIDYHPRPRTQAELDADPSPILVRASIDGRFLSMDQPVVAAGRLPTGRDEALVTQDLARDQRIKLGTVLPISFWSRRTELAGGKQAVPPIGVEHVRVVGIGRLHDEILPDSLYPRETIILSHDLAKKYDCLPTAPPSDASMEQSVLALAPERCATSYRYYSLMVRGGDDGVAAALRAFNVAANRLTKGLPTVLLEQHVAYTLVAKSATSDEQRRVNRSTQPLVIALAVLAAAAAVLTILILGFATARDLVRVDAEQSAWWRLGLTTSERARILIAARLGAVGAGIAVGALAAWLLSPIAPMGNVRAIDPTPGLSFARPELLTLLGLAVVALTLVVVLGRRAARRAGRAVTPRRARTAVQRLARSSTRPDVAEGLRAASRTRGAGLVFATGTLAVAVFVAAVGFGASLSSLLSTPRSFGWSWNIAALDNFGFGGINTQSVHKTLAARADVERWTTLGFSNSIAVNGESVPALLAFDQSSDIDLAVLRGRLPHASDEVALGAATARAEHVSVGTRVQIAGYEVTPRRARVTGIVVLPAIGPFRAASAEPGVGVLVPQAMVDPSQVAMLPTFVGIELKPGTDTQAVASQLRPAFKSWNASAITTFEYSQPIRPPEVIDARSMRVAPLLVGGLLVVGAIVGLVIGIAMSVRGRRRDLAILRALGFTGGQLRRSVLVQAVANTTASIVIGVPLGLVLARIAWRAFASRLGVVGHSTIPLGWIVTAAVGAEIVALLATALPARAAARTPSIALRSE